MVIMLDAYEGSLNIGYSLEKISLISKDLQRYIFITALYQSSHHTLPDHSYVKPQCCATKRYMPALLLGIRKVVHLWALMK
jgi:hypothetical protein